MVTGNLSEEGVEEDVFVGWKVFKERAGSFVSSFSRSQSASCRDEFDKLRHFCYSRTDALLLCFSVVSPASFQNAWEKWVPEIRRRCPLTPLLLVGTQCDLRQDVKVLIELARRRERPVPEQDARALADKMGAVTYVECSALTQKNLKEVFDAAIAVALRQSDRRARRERKVRSTADKMKTLSKAWWKRYVCVR
ncbi:unnamed protein product [Lota lota]